MNVASMVALQVLGGVILAALMIARVVVARRKHWLPYYSERFGVAAFSGACAVGIALTIYWTVNGARVCIADGKPGGGLSVYARMC